MIIVISRKRNINIASMALVAAFAFGTIGLKILPKVLLGYIPVQLVFNIVSITWFYGYAIENGTVEVLVDRILRRCEKISSLSMVLIFLISVLIGGIGVGINAIPLVAPIAFAIGERMKISPIVTCAAIHCGATTGSAFMYSYGGTMAINLMEEVGCGSAAAGYAIHCFTVTAASETIGFLLIFLFFKGYRVSKRKVGILPKFNNVQRVNAVLIAVVTLTLLLPPIINYIYPSPFWNSFNQYMDVGFIMTGGACIAALLKLADERKVIRDRIPYGTLLMLSGVTVLMGVAKEAGLIETLTDITSQNVPTALLIPVLAMCAGIMSMFSGAFSVVCPMLFPIIPLLAVRTGMPAESLFAAVMVSACATGICPYSTGGSMLLSCISDGKMREIVSYRMLGLAFLLLAIVSVCAIVI